MKTNQIKKTYLEAFTLVELIVVIVILAILGTIAFLSFNSYSSSARDSVRLSDITNISKWLVMQYAKWWAYPLPDDYIAITAKWINIWYQWFAWVKTLDIVDISSWKDPSDWVFYTYNTNTNQDKYQILWFLEDWGNIGLGYNIWNKYNIFNWVNADSLNYSNRYPLWKWDQIGILLNSWSKIPLQFNYTGTWFEITTATWTNYIAYINKTTTINSTWSILWWLAWFYSAVSASSTYPECDTPDIKLSNWQTWAACNVSATKAFNWVNLPYVCWWTWCINDPYPSSHNIYWGYFQWWRNDDIASTSSTSAIVPSWTLANNVGHNYFINWLVDVNYDWINSRNPDLWWWSWTTYTSWTYYTRWNPTTMQWPCNSWYHVPTMLEWSNAAISINPSLVTSFWAWRQNDKSIINLLKIPFAWYRNYSNWNYMYQWAYWNYWVSSSTSSFGHTVLFGNNKIYILNWTYRANGFSVRCLKNN